MRALAECYTARMKTDLYTKAALTVIAFLLLVSACHRYIDPPATARAEGPFAGVQFTGPDTYSFFDTRTGDLWGFSVCVRTPQGT